MCCMALMAVLTQQGAVASLDRVQHALGVDHVATAVAGPVSFDDHRHDDDHHAEHHEPAAADSDHDDTGPGDQRSDDGVRGQHHHHAGEGSQYAAVEPDRALHLIQTSMTAVGPPPTQGAGSWLSIRLERPPKPLSI